MILKGKTKTIQSLLKLAVSLPLTFVVTGCLNQQLVVYHPPEKYEIISERDYLKQPEHHIDTGIAALLIEKEINPEIDVIECLNRIDEITDKISKRIRHTSCTVDIIRIINEVIFADEGLRYKKKKSFISSIFYEKQGNCVAFTSLYLAVTERLNLPFHAVMIPGHIFVRYQDEKVVVNIETTTGGQIHDDSYYDRMNKIFPQEPQSKTSKFKDLTKIQLICQLLYARGIFHKDRQQYDKALADLQLALKLDGYSPIGYDLYGAFYAEKGEYDKAIANFTKAIELDPDYAQAYNNRGVAYAYIKEKQRAINDWNEGARLSKSHKKTVACPLMK